VDPPSEKDSDAEFEQMLKEAEEVSKDEETASVATPQPRKKAKTKIGTKHKKKKTKKAPGKGKDDEDYEVSYVFCKLFLLSYENVENLELSRFSNKIIKITAKSVNKVVRSFFATPAPERITWSVLIPRWKKPLKANGPAHTVKVRVGRKRRKRMSTMSFAAFARTAENSFVVTHVRGLTIRSVSIRP